jgi:NAD(P)-dependent dehydrogenase (short-subunit alcohol dehydrogenase family)
VLAGWDGRDKVAIVTGSSGGLGAETARALAARGCHVGAETGQEARRCQEPEAAADQGVAAAAIQPPAIGCPHAPHRPTAQAAAREPNDNAATRVDTITHLPHPTLAVLAARDAKKTQRVAAAIAKAHPSASVETLPLDLSSLASVRAFAAAFGKAHTRLDILVCNAGTVFAPLTMSADGLESAFATNHLGHWLLVRFREGALENIQENTGEGGACSLAESLFIVWFGQPTSCHAAAWRRTEAALWAQAGTREQAVITAEGAASAALTTEVSRTGRISASRRALHLAPHHRSAPGRAAAPHAAGHGAQHRRPLARGDAVVRGPPPPADGSRRRPHPL